ncbi:MAG: hypothetical protein ACRD2O_13700, partial [Terriglobia bacterium]
FKSTAFNVPWMLVPGPKGASNALNLNIHNSLLYNGITRKILMRYLYLAALRCAKLSFIMKQQKCPNCGSLRTSNSPSGQHYLCLDCQRVILSSQGSEKPDARPRRAKNAALSRAKVRTAEPTL